MAETRTVAESDRLLDLLNEARAENQRLRDELNTAASFGDVVCREAVASDRMLTAERSALEIAAASMSAAMARADQAEANVRDLRVSLADAHERVTRPVTERCDAQVAQYTAEAECEQLRRELAAPRAGRPSRVYSLGQLVGVAIGAGLVAASAGCGVATEVLKGWPW